MKLPPNAKEDATPVLIAAISVLFHTHPDRERLKAAWEPILEALVIDGVKHGEKNVTTDVNFQIAKMLLGVAEGEGTGM